MSQHHCTWTPIGEKCSVKATKTLNILTISDEQAVAGTRQIIKINRNSKSTVNNTKGDYKNEACRKINRC